MIEPMFIKRGRDEFGLDWVDYSEPNWTEKEIVEYLNKALDGSYVDYASTAESEVL